MKKLMFIAAVAALGIGMTGCVGPGGACTNTALFGGIVDENRAPASFNIDNSVKPAKCGKATSKGVVLYTSGDSSIKAAMDNGGITKVHHIDYEVFSIFNLFSKATTIVYGE